VLVLAVLAKDLHCQHEDEEAAILLLVVMGKDE
jgi:hypothetical protein